LSSGPFNEGILSVSFPLFGSRKVFDHPTFCVEGVVFPGVLGQSQLLGEFAKLSGMFLQRFYEPEEIHNPQMIL